MTTILPQLPFKTDFIPINNFRLHFTDAGSGHPLVLIHGGGTWLYSFRHNIAPLSKNLTVYAFDVPGHGYTQSLSNHNTYNLDTVCEALLSFMDTISLKKASFAGHSWGGGWVICFADRYPDRVDKLVLIDSSGLHRHEQGLWELAKYPFFEKILRAIFTEKTVRKGLEACFYDKCLVDEEMIQNIYAPLLDKTVLDAQISYSRNIDWKETKAALSHLCSQTLIIWGKNDRYIHVRYARRMQALLPDARLEIIDRCGHSAHEEHPQRVNRLIADFIG